MKINSKYRLIEWYWPITTHYIPSVYFIYKKYTINYKIDTLQSVRDLDILYLYSELDRLDLLSHLMKELIKNEWR